MAPLFHARMLLLVAVFLLILPRFTVAQESKGSPEAKAQVARGQAAFEARDYAAAESAFRKAVEIDPAWPEAHSSYQLAVRYAAGARVAEDGVVGGASAAKYQKIIESQYASWVKAHPKTPGYLWAYGDILARTDPAKAEQLCKQALAVDAAFAPAYRTLARLASARGDVKAQLGFLRRASEAAPDSATYLQAHISALWPSDFATARALALQMADRFPSDTATAEVLFDLAAHADDTSEKVQYLERLRQQSGTVLQRAMRLLYDVYAASDPAKALALAEEMAARTPAGPSGRMWADAVARQKDLVRVRALIGQRRFSEAVALLDARAPRALVVIPNLDLSDSSDRELTLLRAEAEAGLGQLDRAYQRVMDLFVQRPGERIHEALSRYASALGKTPARQDDDVRARLTRDAKPAPDFPIAAYPDGRKGSLSDLRGRVVLLNFWFPT